MYDYSRKEQPNVFSPNNRRQNTSAPDYELLKKHLLWQIQSSARNLLEYENRKGSFTVPKGWSLKKIADHLDNPVDDLITLNRNKLQNWNGVEGFNAGEVIVYKTPKLKPEKTKEKAEEQKEEKQTPEQIIAIAYKNYDEGNLSMPDLARTVLPYTSSHSKEIIHIFDDLYWYEEDNFAYALTNNASDSELSGFNRELLGIMSSSLTSFMTRSRDENLKQKERIDKIINQKITDQALGLKNIIDNDKGDEEKIKQIIAYVRQQFEEYPPKIKALKDQQNYSEEEKLRILGKVAALTARIEVLMGAIFYKGTSSENTWETKGSNKGDEQFLKYYQGVQHGVNQQGSAWCAMFVASILNEVLGFAPADKDGKRYAQKGYGWFTWDATSLHDSVNYQMKKKSKYDTRHVKKITNQQLIALRKQVSVEENSTKRYAMVKAFFEKNFTPQSGDLLAVGTKNTDSLGSVTNGKPGFNHSTIIERYIDDSSNNKIYLSTIEGNADQRAGGRLIELTKCDNKDQRDLSFVTQISRVALSNYGVGTNINDGTKDHKLVKDQSKQWSEKDLTEPLKQMSGLLQDYAQTKNYIKKGNHSTAIANLVHSDASGSIN